MTAMVVDEFVDQHPCPLLVTAGRRIVELSEIEVGLGFVPVQVSHYLRRRDQTLDLGSLARFQFHLVRFQFHLLS